MPVSFGFLRGVLGLFALFFAFVAGRVLADFRRGRVKQSRLTAWILRTLVCSTAMIFPRRAVDAVAIAVWASAVLLFAVGFWSASRPRKEEDLTHTIFPDEP
jgi:hypothetical protein